MRTVLVTGGAGFIGGNFVLDAVSARGWQVINLDKLTYAGNPETLAGIGDDPRYTFVHGDIGDAQCVRGLLDQHRPDAVVNFAAESHVDRSIDGPAEFVQTNVVGTLNLLEATRDWWRMLAAAPRAKFRFLHVSTDEVYGSLGSDGLFSEQSPYAPNSPYAASKAASDHLVRAYHHTYGLPVLTTNCSNNYGPYQFPEKLIPLIIGKALAGDALPIYGDGSNVRDWLYVGDHCSAIRCVLDHGRPGEVYNIGGNSEKTNLEVVHSLCDLLDEIQPRQDSSSYRELIHFVKDRPGHDLRYAIDAGKIRAQLGWTPSESFGSGLRRTVNWYLQHGAWCESIRDGSYQGQRLGLASES